MAGAIDESTLRTIDDGRTALGEILSSAQSELRKIFLVFALGFAGSFYALREWVFPYLKSIALPVKEGASVNALTAMDVVLLQTKVAMFCGILIAIPAVLYVSREMLRARGWLPKNPLSLWQFIPLVLGAVGLFIAGIAYAHFLFFPMLFDFLVSNANQSGLAPHYSFVMWFRFLVLISLGMGLAAELPLFMVLLSYSEIVPYQTFREKWRHAVVGIYVCGAVFTPPDPFTQIMWATPILGLYVFSLLLTRFIITLKYSSEEFGLARFALRQWNVVLGSMLLTTVAVYQLFASGYGARANAVLQGQSYVEVPALPRIEAIVPLPRGIALIAVGVLVALVVGVAVYLTRLFQTVDPAEMRYAPAPASAGDPETMDIERLDADSIAVTPPELFGSMSEDEALEHASRAMNRGNPEKAEAILDRFDSVEQQSTEDGDTTTAKETGGDVGDVITGTTTGVVNSFTENDQTEDDIGGYFYDIQFVLSSLTSKVFRIIGVFVVVMAAVFTAMYKGGLKLLKQDFLSRLPENVPKKDVSVATLHPVEGLIFDVKMAVVAGIVATLPVLLYYMWPALKERGIVSSRGGSRGAVFMWTVSSLIALIIGSIIGYTIIAPTVISWLANDAIQADMLIKYRISAAGWLVFFTTVGIGLLATIPTTLVYLHRSGFVPFSVLSRRWREAVILIIGVIAVAAPGGAFGMLLFSLPVVGAYLLGLIILWVYTLGGRRVSPFRKSRQL